MQADSTCRVIFYRDKTDRLMLGVYDVLRVQGVEYTHLPLVQWFTTILKLR